VQDYTSLGLVGVVSANISRGYGKVKSMKKKLPKGAKTNRVLNEPTQVMNRLTSRGDKPTFITRHQFRVPNDTEGRAFIESLKRYMNKDTYILRVRPRGNAAAAVAGTAFKGKETQEDAKWFAVHLVMKKEYAEALKKEE